MANHFDGPQMCNDADFIHIRFRDVVPENHPVKFIDQFIDGVDIKHFESKYKVGAGLKGRAPKDIRLMLKVILYALYCRIYSARKIDYATETFADFWLFTYKKRISHDKISEFIIMHGDDIHTVFLATISLASQNELLDFSALYEDGFKIKANASIKRCRTIDGLSKEEIRLSKNLDAALATLQLPEDDQCARDERKKTQSALEKIASLRDELQKRIKERSEGKAPSQLQKLEEKAMINLTDSDAELMRQKDKSSAVSYLKVTAVDPKSDIVLGSTISGHDNENQQSLSLALESNSNCKDAGCDKKYDTTVADSGFITGKNCADFEKEKISLIGPTQSHEHSVRTKDSQEITFHYAEKENTVTCSQGAVLLLDREYYSTSDEYLKKIFSNPQACSQCPRLNDCTKSKDKFRTVKLSEYAGAQQRVLDRYLSEAGQQLYKKRSHSAETYQGDLKQNGGFQRFLRRGIKKVKIDSVLHDIVWNLRRIFNTKGLNVSFKI